MGGSPSRICARAKDNDIATAVSGVFRVVADLSREGGQPLVGLGQLDSDGLDVGKADRELARAPGQLEDVDDALGQDPERLELGDDHRTRHRVEDAQGADHHALVGDQPVCGVEAHVPQLAVDEGVVPEAVVRAGIGDDHRPLLLHGGRAHRVLAAAHAGVEADSGDLVLLGLGEEVDGRHRYAAQPCCEIGDRQQVATG